MTGLLNMGHSCRRSLGLRGYQYANPGLTQGFGYLLKVTTGTASQACDSSSAFTKITNHFRSVDPK